MNVKEPYYLDTYNTSIKSFNSPYIAKTGSFGGCMKRTKSDRTSFDKPRSNSLEPYFRPSISISHELYDDVIVDDDIEFDDYKDFLTVNLKQVRYKKEMNVRDDYDNDVKFDFYL